MSEDNTAQPTVPVAWRRVALAWAVMVGALAAVWCCRPWLGFRAFAYGQLVALLASWKVAALLCLTPREWARLTPLRLLAFCIAPAMQPRQFLVGAQTPAGAPVPTVRGLIVNAAAGAALLWGAPHLLPEPTPWAVRFATALSGMFMLSLVARLDFYALILRAMGFSVEKVWDCPAAAASLGEFWGRRWNRIVSGFLREVVFLPAARRAGPRPALFAVFLYSGFYHEIVSFLGGAGYGGPAAYFLIQYLGTAAEGVRPFRRTLLAHPWLGRLWTLAVVAGPAGLLVHRAFVETCLVPVLAELGVPGIDAP
jgi:alginate O-acetyltransferase complex protein AlgI